MEQKYVLVDIDGTLVSITPNWSLERDQQWANDTLKAEPLEGGIALIKGLHLMGYKLVFLTARGQKCKPNTWKKFRELKIDHMVHSMWHRPRSWDGISSVLYKEHMIKMLMRRGFVFQFSLEDEEKNQEMMRSFGMTVIDAKGWW